MYIYILVPDSTSSSGFSCITPIILCLSFVKYWGLNFELSIFFLSIGYGQDFMYVSCHIELNFDSKHSQAIKEYLSVNSSANKHACLEHI